MTTLLKLGPADHDRKLTEEELNKADYQAGYKYEIIDGKLYVSPLPNSPQDRVEKWLFAKLFVYSRIQSDAINYVTDKARVFVPNREDLTVAEPDLAAYRNYPLHLPFEDVRWEDVSPILVGEILSGDNPDKDLERNVDLYFQVSSIREYWIVDTRESATQPNMTAQRRYGKRWRNIEVAFGEIYTTRLLPGFELKLDPRS
jgi:Uma2 family endonuclease